MNKKFSTLIASLMLAGSSSVAAMVQADIRHENGGLNLKSDVPYRTQSTKSDAFDKDHYGVKKIESNRWYQLEVSVEGSSVPSYDDTNVLVQYRDYDSGELRLKRVKQKAIKEGTVANQGNGAAAFSAPSLNSSLWRIEVVDKTPGAYLYTFINKETGAKLSFNFNDAHPLSSVSEVGTNAVLSGTGKGTVNKTDANAWRWYTADEASSAFKASKLYSFNQDRSKVLGLVSNSEDEILLVDVPASQVTSGGLPIGNYNVLALTVRNAGARVLNAADLNSMIDADNSWANRSNSANVAKFKEVNKGFAANDFFTTDYIAYDTQENDLANDSWSPFMGHSIVLKDSKSDKYFSVATDETYDSAGLISEYGGLKVHNSEYNGDPTSPGIDALKARYLWKVTYYPTPDSLVFEPFNASMVANADRQANRKWKDTPLANAGRARFYNTVNLATAHPSTGATSTTNAPFAKHSNVPVALTLMNSAEPVLTVGQPANAVEGIDPIRVSKYGYPVLTDVPAEMGLTIRFDHQYTYLNSGSPADDVYFIQLSVAESNKTDYRKEGVYLVYNMEGRLTYDIPDEYQDYELMPATQWVVERDENDNPETAVAPYVTIRNREYGDKAPHLFYGQLYQVEGTEKYYLINQADYDVTADRIGVFPNETPFLSSGDTIYFTPAKLKTDNYLGYKKFASENLRYETYAMNYLNPTILGAPDTNNYLNVDEANGLLNVSRTFKNEYELEELSVDREYGVASEKANAAQLYRTVYALKVRNKNLTDDQWNYVVVEEDANRNLYYGVAPLDQVDGKNVKLGTFYFKADQITSKDAPEVAYALVDATGWSSQAAFKKEFWVNGLTSIEGYNRETELNSVNAAETAPYEGRLYADNGYKLIDVNEQTARVSFVSLNTVPTDRVAAFVFSAADRPLYKTLETTDNVNIYRQRGSNAETSEFLFEDGHNAAGLTAGEFINGFRYLGVTAENVKPVGEKSTTAFEAVPVISSNDRMPKYLFFVDVDRVADGRWCTTNTHGYFPSESTADEADASHHVFYHNYIAGRVMINLNDSVEKYRDSNKLDQAHKFAYRNSTRLGFTEAIYMNITEEEVALEGAFDYEAGEYLFVFKNTTLAAVASEWGVIDPEKLKDALDAKTVDQIALTSGHQNVAFSLRLADDEQENVLLESKALGYAGSYGTFNEASWLQINNGVPVLLQAHNFNGDNTIVGETSTLHQLVSQAQIVKIGKTTANATANEDISVSGVSVVAGTGSVTILNAANKTVTVSNILGQTIAKRTIASDNVTIAAPKGIVIVSVQGADAVKAIVK